MSWDTTQGRPSASFTKLISLSARKRLHRASSRSTRRRATDRWSSSPPTTTTWAVVPIAGKRTSRTSSMAPILLAEGVKPLGPTWELPESYSSTRKVEPEAGSEVTVTVPWWAATTAATMARPSPEPPRSRDRAGSAR